MFVGSYWSQRAETREAAAERIAAFIGAIACTSKLLANWFRTADTKADALRSQQPTDGVSLATIMRVNRRDTDRQSIPQLGYRLALWNGENASISATVGATSPHILNSVILEIDDPASLHEDSYRTIMVEMIGTFDPDHAVVTSDEHLARAGATNPWDAGRFVYERGGTIRASSFPWSDRS